MEPTDKSFSLWEHICGADWQKFVNIWIQALRNRESRVTAAPARCLKLTFYKSTIKVKRKKEPKDINRTKSSKTTGNFTLVHIM